MSRKNCFSDAPYNLRFHSIAQQAEIGLSARSSRSNEVNNLSQSAFKSALFGSLIVTAHRNCVAVLPMVAHSLPESKRGKSLSQSSENRV